MPFGIDDAIMGAIIGSMGTVAGSAIGKNAATGSDLNPRQHRELWTERLRFNQQSRRQRNDLADYEQRRSNYRQGLVRRFNRYQSMYDAGTSRNIRAKGFSQTLGMNEQLYHQQYGMKARSFTQNQLFNQSQFNQNQYLEGMRLNTETAGRAGQRGIAQRQELEGMFPEASPWDLMGTSQNASAGQAVLPGYPSAQSANNAAGPSPSQQLRASEMASSAKMAAMLMPTPAVQAAQAGAHAQMYSSTVHAMSGLAQALIGAQAPLKQAGIAGSKAPSEIDLNKKRGSLAATQAGTEVGKQEIQDYEIPIKKAEARHAGKFYKGRADYESQRTNLGYGQLGVSGLGVIQANRMLNKLGRSLFGQSDKLTKKLSGARTIKSSVSSKSSGSGTPVSDAAGRFGYPPGLDPWEIPGSY
ncbi:hypothetical protein [Thiolapillus sp.]|uniref:hypothetical protein n=1 Tax=Thiolapillus sp. TaxID=2017437 RepID=UPI003AF7F8A0